MVKTNEKIRKCQLKLQFETKKKLKKIIRSTFVANVSFSRAKNYKEILVQKSHLPKVMLYFFVNNLDIFEPQFFFLITTRR